MAIILSKVQFLTVELFVSLKLWNISMKGGIWVKVPNILLRLHITSSSNSML